MAFHPHSCPVVCCKRTLTQKFNGVQRDLQTMKQAALEFAKNAQDVIVRRIAKAQGEDL